MLATLLLLLLWPPPRSTLFPYTTLFRSAPRPLVLIKGLNRQCWFSNDLPYPEAEGHFTIGQMREHLRSEEHTSELQSHVNLVCRLLLEKKNTPIKLAIEARRATRHEHRQ